MTEGRKGSTKAERVFPGTATQWESLTAGMGSSRSRVSKRLAAYNLGKRFQAAMQNTGVRQPLGGRKPREPVHSRSEAEAAALRAQGNAYGGPGPQHWPG